LQELPYLTSLGSWHMLTQLTDIFFAYGTFSYYARDCGYFDFQFSQCKARLVFGKRLSLWNHILEPIFNTFPNVYEQSPLRIFPALRVEAELVK